LFGGAAAPAAALAAAAAKQVPNVRVATVQATDNSAAAREVAARQQAKLQDLYDARAQEEKRDAEKAAASDTVQSKVDQWALKGGASKDIKPLRALLLGLNDILKPFGIEGWTTPDMQELMQATAVKKAYRYDPSVSQETKARQSNCSAGVVSTCGSRE